MEVYFAQSAVLSDSPSARMSSSLAYLNGRFVDPADLAVDVFDTGFVMGATVAEQMRTFGGKLFRLEDHLERFGNSLDIVGLELPISIADLAGAATRLAADDHSQLASGDDLGLCLFATPGPYPTMAPSAESRPTVAMHTYPIHFGAFAEKYERGQALFSSEVLQVPPETLPRALKCRSRMHYYLADRLAAKRDPSARALMLDADRTVLETTTANILIYHANEGLISPPAERILPGISVAATLEIALAAGIAHRHRTITLEDVIGAEEVLMTSTSVCVLPVVHVDTHPVGNGVPGPIYRRLLAGWSELTGVKVDEQARGFASRV